MKNPLHTLNNYWTRWKAFSLKVATFQARIILTIFYFVALAPTSLMQSFSKRRIEAQRGEKDGWIDTTTRQNSLEDLQKQY